MEKTKMREEPIELQTLRTLFGQGGFSIGTEKTPITVDGALISCPFIATEDGGETKRFVPVPQPISALKLEPTLKMVIQLDEDHPKYREIRDKTIWLLGFFPLYVLKALFISVRASASRADEFFAEIGRFCANHPRSMIAHKMLADGNAIECFIMLDDLENFRRGCFDD